ncbi:MULTISPECIES: NAD-dependent epimerase/dehydratase family protein [Rhodococcus]|uniref:NAD-dependent epimerase/dehydratase family protein n=1 Tax=Rhodococcus TaxID=1827 RepID=UPI0019814CF7|nr:MULTISPECIES: NAD-dependent epimerase/dehydratase family protein [Rhodococcus]QSE83049.1 NAD-dependent epimerase/dehydratase family protein [Rhodococcus koreensis]
MMKALVTGAAGFVGSSLARRLVADGWDVVGIDSFTDYYSRDLKRINIASIPTDAFELVEADLNSIDLDPILQNSVDVVFHQAGQPGVRKSWGSEFQEYIDANIAATQRLLEASVKVGNLSRFVYASSSSVYGDALTYPTDETHTPKPVSPYGVSKLAAEHLCTLYAHNFGLPAVSLRYFTVYGPGQRPDMAFTKFMTSALGSMPIPVFGDGEQIRDFTFITDVVDANVRAATCNGVRPGAVFNVAGGGSISVNETLKIIEELHSKPLEIEYRDRVSGDVHRTGGSTELIRTTLNWSPAVSIEEGLSAQYEWARSLPSRIGGPASLGASVCRI